MTCCGASAAPRPPRAGASGAGGGARRPDLRARSRARPRRTSISSCRTCTAPAASRAIERALATEPGVSAARANLTSHRVGVDFDAAMRVARRAARRDRRRSATRRRPFDAAALAAADSDEAGKALLRAMAVAGFAAGNIMLLSVSVWSGADDATRDLFHWISALIALPAIVYAGRPFFRSAWRALAAGRSTWTCRSRSPSSSPPGMSLYETATHGAARLVRRLGRAPLLPARRPLSRSSHARRGALRRRAAPVAFGAERHARRGRTAARCTCRSARSCRATACASRRASASRSTRRCSKARATSTARC